MFLAMNRFRVVRGAEDDFETLWRNRESRLHEYDGFVSFDLLRGATAEDHTLYASHTVWRSRADFDVWLKSPHFRSSHKDAGQQKPMYLGPPDFEGFEKVEGA